MDSPVQHPHAYPGYNLYTDGYYNQHLSYARTSEEPNFKHAVHTNKDLPVHHLHTYNTGYNLYTDLHYNEHLSYARTSEEHNFMHAVHTIKEPVQCYKCSECGKVFRKAYDLKRHMRNHTRPKSHVCPICRRGFQWPCDLRKHILIHSGEKPHICPQCNKGFLRQSQLREHIETHSTELHPCPICYKDCSSLSRLKRHTRAAHKQDIISSQLAGVKDKVNTSQNNNSDTLGAVIENVHNSQKKRVYKTYPCYFCGKEFGCSGHLKRHINIHTGHKPHVCQYCSRGFNNLSHLQRHIYTHIGEKPHVCSQCGKGFIRLSDLKNHLCHFIQGTTCNLNHNLDCQLLKDKSTLQGLSPQNLSGQNDDKFHVNQNGNLEYSNYNLHGKTNHHGKTSIFPSIKDYTEQASENLRHQNDLQLGGIMSPFSSERPFLHENLREFSNAADCHSPLVETVDPNPHTVCSKLLTNRCSDRLEGFTELTDLQSHLKHSHGRESDNSRCFFCVRGFMKEHDLKVHLTTHKN